MLKSIIASLFLFSILSCGDSAEKEEEAKDPGTTEGRIDQVCKCMEENDHGDWQPCYDLNNKYYKAMEGEDQFQFAKAVMDCSKKYKKK